MNIATENMGAIDEVNNAPRPPVKIKLSKKTSKVAKQKGRTQKHELKSKLRFRTFICETTNVSNRTIKLENKDIKVSGGIKRSQSDTGPLVKRLKKDGCLSASQTPLALLNELRSGLNYKIVLSDGPPHCPNFLATVEVDGILFSGSGNAKKQAKQRAAEAALLTLCPNLLTPQSNNENIDFAEDSPVSLESKDSNLSLGQKKARIEMYVAKAMTGGMNPVMALNELMPGLKYECIQESSQKSLCPFIYAVHINNEVYKGSGSNKKSAKAAAARAVLLQKYGNLLHSSVLLAPPSGGPPSILPPTTSPIQLIAANNIAELVVNEYHKVMKGMEEYARRKVLAGVVMTTSPDCTKGTLISVATGTKCISGEYISVKGAVLNDSHAEIISRRGLLRYLYNQLALHGDSSTASDSIFVYDTELKTFKLKQDIRFHLYISTSPCGDARIFSPHDMEGSGDETVDRHPNRQSRGQLRTKIESGEGTIPVKSFEPVQTWDGVIQGERLLTMSCSDKLGKWNVVGIQGSLLSHFVEPIYLHSVVIGSLFHPTHLRRALYSRIENTLEGLPPPYRLNKVLMNTTTSPESRHPGKAPNHAVNWISGEETVEIVNAITGKTLSGSISRLCKQRLFGKFYGLLNMNLPSRTNMNLKSVPEVYIDAKNAATDYKDAKEHMSAAFLKAGLGVWMKKPIEQDQFVLDVNM
ncbi:double-stranded RNA-specific editase Adar isoform X2 [Halyomorpha halys]|uniref:double-stranded RNA-specific editase Adar isoform X2 n=1 Tax=Halyomorpha halys TaxID=286706 RepID=UPI0034D31549